MPLSAFPLSHNSSFRPGYGWHWWAVEFEAGEARCRLLVTLHEGKRCYRAWLGVEGARGLSVMGRLEFEPAHPDEWHCHLCCADSNQTPTGVVRHGPSVRTRRFRMARHRVGFPVSHQNALNIGMEFFGVDATLCPPDGGLFDA